MRTRGRLDLFGTKTGGAATRSVSFRHRTYSVERSVGGSGIIWEYEQATIMELRSSA